MNNIYISFDVFDLEKYHIEQILNSFDKIHSEGEWKDIKGCDYKSSIDLNFIKFNVISEANTFYLEKYKLEGSTLNFFDELAEKVNEIEITKGLGIGFIEKGITRITFYNLQEDLTSAHFREYDDFFTKLYQSLPNKAGYVCYVDVGNHKRFFREHDLRKYKCYSDPFMNQTFFWHCITPPSIYEKYNTKEQLLGCPFYSIKELEEGHLDIQQFDEPLEITSEKSLNYLHEVRKYLSENNLYGHLFE
ncbi:hypothetical protein [Sediminitomix flava]|uniref:Uncharacterized protein n=1 Tax=Sediminitomix flava TaxID=379075 RepID=A0A315ZC54_SEDFL|nr:hypothetical protein [Sediminitomix flava]PWJ42699.1 hypothetical protein BC781_102244 [Sediminitomix flava]